MTPREHLTKAEEYLTAIDEVLVETANSEVEPDIFYALASAVHRNVAIIQAHIDLAEALNAQTDREAFDALGKEV
jgi:hypothetical protein